ncbi:MAG: hypothetical protein NC548_27415 [Lachnospiraceae bacterium]|nr:hypothetical protein [Lachnospiraceae bacterium]
MVEPIKPIGDKKEDKPSMGTVVEGMHNTKKKIAKGFLNNSGIFVGVFLVFVVIVVFTTDIQLSSFADWAKLGLAFFVLLFCSYSMYINFSDTGMRAGKESESYKKTLGEYDGVKKDIISNKQQGRLLEFCRHFIIEELQNTRHAIIADVGLDFKLYKEKYVGMSKKALAQAAELTEPQRKAIIKANKVKPIKLTPEMIFKRGRGAGRRVPLGTNPHTKKGIAFGVKFVKISVTTLLTSIIVLDVVVNPSWATFAACCLKLMPVILNGFTGYKMGYENIVYDTVNYMSDQIDLIHQFQQYVAENPVPVSLTAPENGAEELPETENAEAQDEAV